VVDTNVYVSGLLWTGLPHDLLSAAEAGQLTLVATPAIIEEVREVLARPKFATRMRTLTTSVDELLESLLGIVQILQEPKVVRVVRADPDDDKFIACAVAARVRWLVSSDTHLLSLRRYKSIRIVTPQQFWTAWGARLKKRKNSCTPTLSKSGKRGQA
jgi:putative PIN family toxin of toxin-antitoxin system